MNYIYIFPIVGEGVGIDLGFGTDVTVRNAGGIRFSAKDKTGKIHQRTCMKPTIEEHKIAAAVNTFLGNKPFKPKHK